MKDSKELKEIFLERVSKKMENFKGRSQDYKMRKMCDNLHKEFDDVWISYLNGDSDFERWEKSLDNWLNAELIGC